MVQMYLIQGFKMEGNANNVVTLKKKGYNTAVLVLLILFVMIIGGIIYYLLCEDEMVIIKNVGDESINSNFNINTIPKSEITGFYSQNEGVSTKLTNYMENIQNWYHKPDKSHIMALIYSILLPFSGNLYLRENIINLVFTVISILFIFGNIIGLLTTSDFYYRNEYLISIYVVWWIISMAFSVLFIVQYNNNESYFEKENDNYSKKSQLPNSFNNNYIKYIPFVMVILFLIVSMEVMLDDSPKTFDTNEFSFQYPHEYQSNGEWLYNSYDNSYYCQVQYDSISVTKFEATKSIDGYVDDLLLQVEYPDGSGQDNVVKGKTKVDGLDAYVIQVKDLKWTNVMFIKDGELYQLCFKEDGQKHMDEVINSFKFK